MHDDQPTTWEISPIEEREIARHERLSHEIHMVNSGIREIAKSNQEMYRSVYKFLDKFSDLHKVFCQGDYESLPSVAWNGKEYIREIRECTLNGIPGLRYAIGELHKDSSWALSRLESIDKKLESIHSCLSAIRFVVIVCAIWWLGSKLF